jgi:hypothetical protein
MPLDEADKAFIAERMDALRDALNQKLDRTDAKLDKADAKLSRIAKRVRTAEGQKPDQTRTDKRRNEPRTEKVRVGNKFVTRAKR